VATTIKMWELQPRALETKSILFLVPFPEASPVFFPGFGPFDLVLVLTPSAGPSLKG